MLKVIDLIDKCGWTINCFHYLRFVYMFWEHFLAYIKGTYRVQADSFNWDSKHNIIDIMWDQEFVEGYLFIVEKDFDRKKRILL